jgi:hypothetical protein
MAAFGGKQAPPFGKKGAGARKSSKGRKPTKDERGGSPASKALRQPRSMRGGGRY